MTLGPVRVMGTGVVMMMFVEEVAQHHNKVYCRHILCAETIKYTEYT